MDTDGIEVAVVKARRDRHRGRAVKRIDRVLVGFVLSLILGGLSVPGRSVPGAPQAAFQAQKPLRHEVAVTLKLIQVYVTDKAGKPAMGLALADFRLFDNGEPQKITEFEVHKAENPPPRPTAAASDVARAEQPVPPSRPAPPVPPALLGRKFFFFFDLESNDLPGIAKARAAALHFLDTATLPTDEVGVFSYAFMSGLVMHAFLTTDHAKVREAILRVRDVPGRRFGESGGADTAGIVVSGQDGQPVSVTTRMPGGGAGAIYASRMTALAKALRYIPGTKNILFFSQGGSIASREVRERVEEMSREYAAANAPLYTVNTETPDPFNPGGSKGEAALQLVARQSGGKSYPEIGAVDRFPAIAGEIHSLTRNYYVLGYPVRESWDGKYHKIEVEVVRGDYGVRAQSGYFNPKPFKDYSGVERELHLFDLALSEKPAGQGPLLFPMRALRFSDKGEEGILLIAEIPAAVLAKFAGRRIELVALVLDDRDLPAARSELKPDIRKVREREVVFLLETFLDPGVYRCRIILRDLETGDAALAYTTVAIPSEGAGGLRLFSPLLLISFRPALLWEGRAGKEGRRWMETYKYDAARYSLLAGETPSGTRTVRALVPYALSAVSGGNVTLRAMLIDAAKGGRIDLPVSVVSKARQGDFETQCLECGLDGVPAGKYLLYIHGEDEDTRAVSYANMLLTIR